MEQSVKQNDTFYDEEINNNKKNHRNGLKKKCIKWGFFMFLKSSICKYNTCIFYKTTNA